MLPHASFSRLCFRAVFAVLASIALPGDPLLGFAAASYAAVAPGEPGAPHPKPAATAPDTLTFTNGDTLHGKLNREVGGTVFFQSEILGEVSVPWSKIRSLETRASFVVLENKPGAHIRRSLLQASQGTVAVADGKIAVEPGDAPPPIVSRAARQEMVRPVQMPIPVADAPYILDLETFNRQVRETPNLFAGWNGSATAGVTLVEGTENQRTYTSSIALVRTVPTVSWLNSRNRTQAGFSSSYGKITQPAYFSRGVLVPSTYTKSSIFHADAERDQYFTNRLYVLVQTAFDHNFSQGLDLQQVYGGGLGVTAIKRPAQQLDLKATLQYEKQQFIAGAAGTSHNLIGSTISATYLLKLPRSIVFNQQIAYVPTFNNVRDYSASETDALTFPFYKNVAFTVGTIDSYLNDPVPAEPPTTRNSFQFTTGITYTLKSKY